jgi:hypothetical protein
MFIISPSLCRASSPVQVEAIADCTNGQSLFHLSAQQKTPASAGVRRTAIFWTYQYAFVRSIFIRESLSTVRAKLDPFGQRSVWGRVFVMDCTFNHLNFQLAPYG